jgi:hyperosmotically inducible protein
MTKTMRIPRASLLAATLVLTLLSLPRISLAAAQISAASAQVGNQAANDAAARLDKAQFRGIKVNVDQGIATLTGSVDLYAYKADAEKRVQKAKGVDAVRNLIEVGGPNVPDNVLLAKLTKKLAWDRVGYGNVFNAVTIHVQNGTVAVGGHARTETDRDSALALITTYPGVKDVVGKIEVDPVSVMDDHRRMAVARAIYGYASLDKYGNDPAKPIRISVQNGHVELYGVVDSQADKDTAYLRAESVPGIFSVTNYLQVAGQPTERQN